MINDCTGEVFLKSNSISIWKRSDLGVFELGCNVSLGESKNSMRIGQALTFDPSALLERGSLVIDDGWIPANGRIENT